MQSVLLSINPDELAEITPEISVVPGSSYSPPLLAEAMWIDRFGPSASSDILGFGDKLPGDSTFSERIWHGFKREWFTLLCTEEPRYEELRAKVGQLKGQPATIVVSAISVGMGHQLGVTAGILTPFVAILMHGILTVGLGTVCSAMRSESL